MERPKIRQWLVDSDDPYIERNVWEAAAYFKRRRAEAGARLREAAPRLRAWLDELSTEPDES
jgi:hypothetical protein